MDDRRQLPGHRGRTPAWYRTVIVIDVFTLIVLGVGWLLRGSESSWPIVMLMLPFAAHLAATVVVPGDPRCPTRVIDQWPCRAAQLTRSYRQEHRMEHRQLKRSPARPFADPWVYRTAIIADVIMLIIVGMFRTAGSAWPFTMAVLAGSLAATVLLAIRDARRRAHQSVYDQVEWVLREREVTGRPAYDYIANAESLQRAAADATAADIVTPDGSRLLSSPIDMKQVT